MVLADNESEDTIDPLLFPESITDIITRTAKREIQDVIIFFVNVLGLCIKSYSQLTEWIETVIVKRKGRIKRSEMKICDVNLWLLTKEEEAIILEKGIWDRMEKEAVSDMEKLCKLAIDKTYGKLSDIKFEEIFPDANVPGAVLISNPFLPGQSPNLPSSQSLELSPISSFLTTPPPLHACSPQDTPLPLLNTPNLETINKALFDEELDNIILKASGLLDD